MVCRQPAQVGRLDRMVSQGEVEVEKCIGRYGQGRRLTMVLELELELTMTKLFVAKQRIGYFNDREALVPKESRVSDASRFT